MPHNPFREAGLPQLTDDLGGEHGRYGLYKGVVMAVYPNEFRVDIQPEEGGLITKALVLGDVLPEVHIDVDNPQHVIFAHLRGHVMDPICWILPFRRMQGVTEQDDGHERHYFHKNQQIIRVKDITIRITPDNRIYLFDAESDDYCMYDMANRTIHTIVPHIFMGTDEGTRYEYHKDDQVRIVIPECLVGQTAVQNADGLTYLAQQLLHLVSTIEVRATAGSEIHLLAPLIKMTAQSIVLDPVNIRFGHAGADQQLVLGNLWMTFYNAFVAAFNAHGHTNVQNGLGTSGPPVTPTAAMTDALLSDIARVSKTGV